MSKLSKRVSDKLDNAAGAVISTGQEVGGDVGVKVANVLCATFLGRFWEPCSHTCECYCTELR